MSIKKICNNNVIRASHDVSVYKIANLMKYHNIGDVIIVEDEESNLPIGIITDRDIVTKVISNEVDLRTITAGDIMSDDLLLLKEHQGIMESFNMMSAKGVRRAPIINSTGSLTGIVSTDDLVLLIANEMESYAKLIRKQLSHMYL